MLDVLLPVPSKNLDLAPNAITSLIQHTDIPFRLLVIVDGGIAEDLAELRDHLGTIEQPWRLLHESPAVGLNAILREGLADCRERLTAIMSPETRLWDPQWFGKVKQVFDRDPICGIVDFEPDTKSTTQAPIRRPHNKHPNPGCRFMVVQTAYAQKTLPYGINDPAVFWAQTVHAQGGSAWHIPAVRYTEVVHTDHMFMETPLGAGR